MFMNQLKDIMKSHQFEEICFWLSLIATLISYHLEIKWLFTVLLVLTIINLIAAVYYGIKYSLIEKEFDYDDMD